MIRTSLALMLALGVCAPCAAVAQTDMPSTAPAMGGTTMGGGMMMHKPTKEQIETAIKAAHPSLRQLRALKPMVQSFKAQSAAATDESEKIAAAKQLYAGMNTVFSPEQMMAFKESLKAQMMDAPH
jgi:hypothetical protein